jgi:WD40 repeat protein
MAFGSSNQLVAINPASLEQRGAPEGFLAPQHSLVFRLGNLFNEGRTAAVFNPAEEQMEIWDLRHRRLLCSVESLGVDAAFAPKTQLLATAIADQTVGVWQLPEGRRKWVLTNSAPPLAFSPDGALLVAEAEPGRSIRVWHFKGGIERAETITYGGGEHRCSLALSPDARLLAIGTWEGMVALLRMPAGQPVAAFVGHKRAVSSLCFSPDGRTLASMSNDRTLRLWHVASQREVARFEEASEDTVFDMALAFSPDGRALAAKRTWADGEVTRVWYAPSFAEIADAKAKQDTSIGDSASPRNER